MPVQYILHNLLANNDGAVGTLFLDESGETVELVCSEQITPYELRILGAYLGIYLRQVERICTADELGAPEMIHIEKRELHIYARALPDGYYVVLLQRRPGLVAVAQRTLAEAAGHLHQQFFAVEGA